MKKKLNKPQKQGHTLGSKQSYQHHQWQCYGKWEDVPTMDSWLHFQSLENAPYKANMEWTFLCLAFSLGFCQLLSCSLILLA